MVRIFRLLARISPGPMQSLGAVLGRLAAALSPSYRRKIAANLARAGIESRLLGECAAQAGRMVGELPFVWFAPAQAVLQRVRCDDAPVFDAALGEGKGVIVLTPHIGSFEVAARWFAARAPMTVLFKPPKLALLAGLLETARNQGAMRSQPTTLAGVRGLLRALRAGEAVGVLPDQVPDAGMGVWAPFFGEPAYTLTLPQRLARSTGAAVLLVWGERMAGAGEWTLHIERLPGPPAPDTLNLAMQALILRQPTQYLWGYNRYKRPAAAQH
ncbi:MAG: lysophospholipid acyltransferase family protein [Burkholderiaceae bacterium]|nr:lysophospholipid acyltransferase family protein [Burkholderiaceae bacterium]